MHTVNLQVLKTLIIKNPHIILSIAPPSNFPIATLTSSHPSASRFYLEPAL